MNESDSRVPGSRGPDTMVMSTASALHEAAVRYYAQGQPEKAHPIFERLMEILSKAVIHPIK